MNEIAQAGWKLSIIRGVIGIVFGLILIIWPTSALVFVLLWGIFVVLDGLGWFASAFSPGLSGLGRGVLVVLGLLAVVAGALAIFRPGLTVAVLVTLVGIWLVVRGLAGAALALVLARGGTRWWLLLGALLDIVLGVVFFLNPTTAAKAIVVVLGITVVLWGIVLVLLGLALRRHPEDLVPDGNLVIKGEVV
ncbi:HdeD family acid-resistance protein [Aestuariimicrobium sp. Y1814]|uniref:HdeD family acid-resistance protein n=1 Tax=Aestuariimicrobium sp. Y1814 TaxID=3418742 RepID=UPI003DA78245